MTSLLGWKSKTLKYIASALGFSAAVLPVALVNEKLRWNKKIKWVDKKKYIYDIKTTEYITRNGKTAIISEQTIRENGWGN